MRQLPYSPDLAPCDFWLSSKLKTTRFRSRKEIMGKTTAKLRCIPEEEFKRCFQKWQRRWEKCVHLQGKYFEGDYIKFVIFMCCGFYAQRLDTFWTDLVSIFQTEIRSKIDKLFSFQKCKPPRSICIIKKRIFYPIVLLYFLRKIFLKNRDWSI